MAVRYDGPFVIAEVDGKSVYRLTKVTGMPVKIMANVQKSVRDIAAKLLQSPSARMELK